MFSAASRIIFSAKTPSYTALESAAQGVLIIVAFLITVIATARVDAASVIALLLRARFSTSTCNKWGETLVGGRQEGRGNAGERSKERESDERG